MAKKKRSLRETEKRRVQFEASQRSLGRRRTVVGLLGFIPLALSLACGLPAPFDGLCVVPRDWLLLVWGALFGTFLGITIRLVLDRRRYQREAQRGPLA